MLIGRRGIPAFTCALLVLAACGGSMEPATISGGDACAHCRMAVSDPHFAAQVVAPGEEPRFFDDIGCLAAALSNQPLAKDAVVFVADHRTAAWIPAESAVFTRVLALDTPMNSHIVAHASEASRASDGLPTGWTPLTRAEVFNATTGAAR